MQIDPAALSRNDSSNQAKSAAANPSTTVKSSRTLPSVPRLDLEQTYTELKAAIGDKWAEYKEATAFFLLGMDLVSSQRILSSLLGCEVVAISAVKYAPRVELNLLVADLLTSCRF
jgi:hypothetical protein